MGREQTGRFVRQTPTKQPQDMFVPIASISPSLSLISHLIICTRMISNLGYRMADNSRMLRRLFDERVRDLGLTAAQARLLLSLERSPGQNQAYYAEQLEIEPITLTRIIDRMAEAGWVKRSLDPTDRRARILQLTDKARDIVSELTTIIETMIEEVLDGIDLNQRAILSGLLDQIGTNLQHAREKVLTDG